MTNKIIPIGLGIALAFSSLGCYKKADSADVSYSPSQPSVEQDKSHLEQIQMELVTTDRMVVSPGNGVYFRRKGESMESSYVICIRQIRNPDPFADGFFRNERKPEPCLVLGNLEDVVGIGDHGYPLSRLSESVHKKGKTPLDLNFGDERINIGNVVAVNPESQTVTIHRTPLSDTLDKRTLALLSTLEFYRMPGGSYAPK